MEQKEVSFNQIVTAQVEKRMGELVMENVNLRTQVEMLAMKLRQYEPPQGPVEAEDDLFKDESK